MAKAWDLCIEGDLSEMESIITDAVRSDNPELSEMCLHVLGEQGKRLRPSLCMLTYLACGGRDMEAPRKVAAAIEIIHNATLVHDDINDEAELRRGRKALYKEYSLSKSIVTGDYLLAIGFRMMSDTSPELSGYIVDAATSMGVGEFNQQEFEYRGSVTEADYMRIIDGKTARLIETSAKCGAFLAGADMGTIQAMGDFALNVGMAFQIVDDVLDVIGDTEVTGKPVGNDILEGKPTLPIIFAMQDEEHGAAVRRIFEDHDIDQEDVDRAIGLMRKTDFLERCTASAARLIDEGRQHLGVLGDSEHKDSLNALADFVLERNR